jgi:O-antigen ligase
LAACRVDNLRWLKWMTRLFLGLGAVYIAGRLGPGMNRILFLYSADFQGSLFWTWLVALAFSQAVFNRRLHPGWRAVLGCLALAALYLGLFQRRSWISGWIPPLAALMAILWVARPRLGLLATVIGIIGATTQIQKIISLVMIGDNEYSLMTRLEAWRIVLEIVKVNPVLGLGPANYHNYTPLFPILGWAVQFNSHSQYADLIAQTGLLGLICFIWFFAAVAWLGWRLRRRVPDGFPRAYVYGALGGLMGTLVAGGLGDWVLPFFYNVGLKGFRASILSWLFLGGLVALGRIFATQIEVAQHD